MAYNSEVEDLKQIINNKDEEIDNLKTIIKNEQEENKKLKENAAQYVNSCRKLGIF